MIDQTLVQGNPLTLFYHVRRDDGTLATSADFASITTTVTNLTAADTHASVSVDPVEAVTAIVTNDPRYRPTNDAPGYNVAVNISGDEFGDGEVEYEVEVTFTPIVGPAYTRTRTFWCERSPAWAEANDSSGE